MGYVEVREVPASFKDTFCIVSVGDSLKMKSNIGNFYVIVLPNGFEYKIHKDNFERFFKEQIN